MNVKIKIDLAIWFSFVKIAVMSDDYDNEIVELQRINADMIGGVMQAIDSFSAGDRIKNLDYAVKKCVTCLEFFKKPRE